MTIDSEAKKYIGRPEVFADLFNYFLYDGKQVIKPDDLKEMDSTQIAVPYGKSKKIEPKQRHRDILKNAVIKKDSKASYIVILGIENQTNIHYAMPVRNAVYDALTYASQVSSVKSRITGSEYLSEISKDYKLIPVITLVVYFGQKPWDGPLSIHEMLKDTDDRLLNYVPDYRINLLSPVSMDKLEIEKFNTDFRELSEFLKYKKDKNALAEIVRNNDRFHNMDILTVNLINELTNAKIELQSDTGGKIDMCEAIEGIREDARQEGKEEKAVQTAMNLIRLGKITLEEISMCSGLSLEKVESLAENHLSL